MSRRCHQLLAEAGIGFTLLKEASQFGKGVVHLIQSDQGGHQAFPGRD